MISLSKPQYQLVESGGLLDPVDEESMQDVVDQLFTELVTEIKPEDEIKKQSRKHLLYNTSKRLIRRSGLMNLEGYREDFPYVCRVNDTPLSFKFDYAVFNNGPQLAMSRVSEDSADVYSAAYQFQHMSVKLSREQQISLVFARDEDLDRENCRNSHEVLREHTMLINLADETTATEQLAALVD